MYELRWWEDWRMLLHPALFPGTWNYQRHKRINFVLNKAIKSATAYAHHTRGLNRLKVISAGHSFLETARELSDFKPVLFSALLPHVNLCTNGKGRRTGIRKRNNSRSETFLRGPQRGVTFGSDSTMAVTKFFSKRRPSSSAWARKLTMRQAVVTNFLRRKKKTENKLKRFRRRSSATVAWIPSAPGVLRTVREVIGGFPPDASGRNFQTQHRKRALHDITSGGSHRPSAAAHLRTVCLGKCSQQNHFRIQSVIHPLQGFS